MSIHHASRPANPSPQEVLQRRTDLIAAIKTKLNDYINPDDEMCADLADELIGAEFITFPSKAISTGPTYRKPPPGDSGVSRPTPRGYGEIPPAPIVLS